MAIAAFPGTFDPPTIAHLAVAEAVWRTGHVDRVEFVLSRDPIGKGAATPVERRVAGIEPVLAGRPWLSVAVTEHRLITEVAHGYDALVVGADKWAQILDPSFHHDEAAWQASMACLPRLWVARRGDLPIPDHPLITVLDIDLGEVSSTAVREGRTEWRAGAPN